jgi:hypothetical protein
MGIIYDWATRYVMGLGLGLGLGLVQEARAEIYFHGRHVMTAIRIR